MSNVKPYSILKIPMWQRSLLFAIALLLNSLALRAQDVNNAVLSAKEVVILAYGDSLTAGFQLPPDKSFPAQLQNRLRLKGYNVRVINSGVSGDTASDGLARLEWSLTEKPDIVIVELGANDMLRGLDPAITERALDEILSKFKALKAEILLAGMDSLGNWGADYAVRFRSIYPKLAEKHSVKLYPFFLKGVAGVKELNLSDGLHPTAEGVSKIVENILPEVEALLKLNKN